MVPVWVVVGSLAFLAAAAVLVARVLVRQARSAAAAEASQAGALRIGALEQDVKNWEGRARELAASVVQHEQRAAKDQDRFVALSSELARVTAAVERVPALEALAEERSRQLDDERRRGASLAAQLAKATADLEAAVRRDEESSGEIARLRERAEGLQGDVTALVEEKTRLAADLDGERKGVTERAADAERSKEQVRAELELLAARLLDEKGKAMLHQSREGLEALLKPVAEKLREFEAKVEKAYDQENRDRASLLASLQRLQDVQTKLHKDAESLSRALTGESKAQGDWGELVLERVLETAGLTEGREYELQVSHVDHEGGRKRPDALVYLPGNRVVVVDAKCSLTAFVEAMRAEQEERRDAALDQHVVSVRAHVRELAAKSYQDVVKGRTVDIVLLFVPNEAAFHAAIAREAGLYEEAFRQGVVLCSPTTLLAALQLISHVWRSEKQNVNAQKIADEAGKMLEKLAAFVSDLDEVGARLEQAQASFQTARRKLDTGRGNVLKKAADIFRLGARVRAGKGDALLLEAAAEDDAVGMLDFGVKVPEPSCGAEGEPVA